MSAHVYVCTDSFYKEEKKRPDTLLCCSCHRPVVNVLNFKFVPPTQRVLAVNVCAILWNAYLR
jgi:hypothetical protein